MKRERTSYAFLLEMIWVCAFFLICASIFVMAFAKAEQLSRQADVLNQAVQATSNVMEEVLAVYPDDQEQLEMIPSVYATEEFSIELDHSFENGLAFFTITTVFDAGNYSGILNRMLDKDLETEEGLLAMKLNLKSYTMTNLRVNLDLRCKE
jgi:hypothetical protein